MSGVGIMAGLPRGENGLKAQVSSAASPNNRICTPPELGSVDATNVSIRRPNVCDDKPQEFDAISQENEP